MFRPPEQQRGYDAYSDQPWRSRYDGGYDYQRGWDCATGDERRERQQDEERREQEYEQQEYERRSNQERQEAELEEQQYYEQYMQQQMPEPGPEEL